MSSSEQGSPPKISDEDGEGGIRHMYTRELGGYFPEATQNQSSNRNERSTSQNSTKPYNEWKNDNHHLFAREPQSENRALSHLGQNLQQMNTFITPEGKFESPSLRSQRYARLDKARIDDSPRNANHFRPEYSRPEHQSPNYYDAPRQIDHPNYYDAPRQLEHQPKYYDAPRQIDEPNYYDAPRQLEHHQPKRYDARQMEHQSPNYYPNLTQNRWETDIYPKSPYNLTAPYVMNSPYANYPRFMNKSCPCESSHFKSKSKKQEKARSKQISDLYRIVWLQNEQLSLLQSQVKKLIEMSLKTDKTEEKEEVKKVIKGTKEMRTFNLSVIEENQNTTEKVSVGIMTSFIENGVASKDKKKKQESSSDTSESSEEETVKPRSKQSKKHESFTLNGVDIPSVVDNVPSPENSFHLDMQDYNSSSCSESVTSESEDEERPKVGWTFYDNVVGKVNNMLKKEESPDSDSEIRNATLDQLKKLGISFVEPEVAPKRVTFGQAYKELPMSHKLHADSDTSMRMNALASKYLAGDTGKSEKLREIVAGQSSANLSFATMRYLERYQLVPQEKSSKSDENERRKKKRRSDEKKSKKAGPSKAGKILDVTAIKKQPKLLPKKM